MRAITNALSMAQSGHAYLFCGPRGTGKTTMARLLAKALNCSYRSRQLPTDSFQQTSTKPKAESRKLIAASAEPCNACLSCKEIAAGRAVDLIEIDAASNRGIDEIRELREGIRFVPVSSPYKVFVVDECHQLTKEAANALLKTLEEPPAHAVFVLATTEPHKMLATIISRCQRFDFRFPTREELRGRVKTILKKEKRALSDAALDYVLAASGGSVRDAESILGAVLALGENPASEEVRQLLGLPDMHKVGGLVGMLSMQKKEEALSHIQALAFEGADMEQYAKTLVQYLRGMLLTKVNPSMQEHIIPEIGEDYLAEFIRQRDALAEERIHYMLKTFLAASNEIKYASLAHLPLELAIVDVCARIDITPL